MQDHKHDWSALEHWDDSQIRLHMVNRHRDALVEAIGLPESADLVAFHSDLHHHQPVTKAVTRWADSAMYRSEPLDASVGPKVILLNATPDPLGSLAALCAMYTGRVVRSLGEVTDEERRQAFADMQATELQGPLEGVQFHFLIEGVTRSWTHQAVRERQAFFAQESMRFAVVENQDWTERVAYPPSLGPQPERLNPLGPTEYRSPEARAYALQRDAWDDAVINSQVSYQRLIEAGVPAEDARGLMPHAMTTRLHMVLNLRSLLHLAGLRLCTQAQFEWRQVMAQMVLALREYEIQDGMWADGSMRYADPWQFELIADALRPVCYQKGQCGFMAKFDRGCTIRERVEANARVGRPSSRWNEPFRQNEAECDSPGEECACTRTTILPINNIEWAADPTAARRGN